MILDGFRIMAAGMGVVFLILIFLVTAVPISAKIIHAIEGPPRMEKKPLPAATPNEDKNRLAAAITAAVMKFRKTK